MQVVLSGESLKAFLKNLGNMLRVGERVEITVLKRKGKNTYLVEIKGNIFEALFSKDVKSKAVVAQVKTIKPEVVFKGIEQDVEIKLVPFKKQNLGQSIGKSEKLDEQRFVILLKSGKGKVNSEFSKGEIITAEIVSKKSGNRYVLSIKGSPFEALSMVEGLDKGDKIVLFVESVKPDVVLKIVGGGSEFIEFIPSSKGFKGSEKFVVGKDDFGELLMKLEQIPAKLEEAFENKNFKEVFKVARNNSIVLEKFLEPFETLKKAVEFVLERLTSKEATEKALFTKESIVDFGGAKIQGANDGEAPKDLNFMVKSIYKEAGEFSKNEISGVVRLILEEKEPKPPTIIRFIQAVVESMDRKDLGDIFGVLKTDKIETDLERSLSLLLPVVIQAGNGVKRDVEMVSATKGLTAILERVAEQVDSILRSGKSLSDSLLRLSLFAKEGKKKNFKSLKDVAIEKIIEFSKILREINEKSSSRVDVDAIKNILKHTHSKFAESNIFIQIPVVLKSGEETIFVKFEKEDDGKNKTHNRRKFRIKIASNSERIGFFQIDGVYADGKVVCSVGFERSDALRNFKSKIDNLKLSLGDNVSLDTYLIKKLPRLVRKQLDIKT